MQKTTINIEFHRLAEQFTRKAAQLIIEKVQTGTMLPKKQIEKNVITGEHTASTKLVVENSPEQFVDKIKEEIQSLPEYTRCIEFMEKDPVISKHLNCHIGTWRYHHGFSAWNVFD